MSLDRLSAILTEASGIVATLQAPADPAPLPLPGIRLLAKDTHREYATMWPGSSNGKAFLFQHPHGFIGLHYADGLLYKMLPAEINHSSQPRWRRTRPTCFLYLYLNELREFDVATDQSTLIRKFKDLPNINGMGESDIAEGDDHLVLCSGEKVFVYEISTDRIFSEFNALEPFNNLYLSGDLLPIVGFYDRGVTLRRNGHYVTLASHLCHMDTGNDVHGNPIMVWADDSRDKFHIVKTNTDTGERVDLVQVNWDLAVHVSLPDRAKFAIVTTFSSTIPDYGEILKVWLDSVNGSHVESLGEHGSDVSAGKTKEEKYMLQPKASVSPDGSRFIFDANGSVYAGMT